jgi:hypothetical protein
MDFPIGARQNEEEIARNITRDDYRDSAQLRSRLIHISPMINQAECKVTQSTANGLGVCMASSMDRAMPSPRDRKTSILDFAPELMRP